MTDDAPQPPERLPEPWGLYADVLETIANALFALAAWGGVAVVAAAFAEQAAGAWVYLLTPLVALAGAGGSVRVRAVHVWERTRRASGGPTST